VSIDRGKDERLEEVGAAELAIPKMRRKDCKKRAIPLLDVYFPIDGDNMTRIKELVCDVINGCRIGAGTFLR
jgi:hypothetical protein